MFRKKSISLIIALCLVFTVGAFYAFAADFPDVEGHWAESSIDRWAENGVLNGLEDGSFNPNGEMLRSEAAALFTKLLQLDETPADLSAYVDVNPDAWYAAPIGQCVAKGIMNGTWSDNGYNEMSPNGTVTREQFAVLFTRALAIPEEDSLNGEASDSSAIHDWAKGAVNALVNRGYMNGTNAEGSDLTVEPRLNINRASVAALLDQTIKTYANKSGEKYTADEGGIVLVVADDVTIEATSDDVVVVVCEEGANVSLEGSTEAVDVICTESDVAISDAPEGTALVSAKEEAENTTINGEAVEAENIVKNPEPASSESASGEGTNGEGTTDGDNTSDEQKTDSDTQPSTGGGSSSGGGSKGSSSSRKYYDEVALTIEAPAAGEAPADAESDTRLSVETVWSVTSDAEAEADEGNLTADDAEAAEDAANTAEIKEFVAGTYYTAVIKVSESGNYRFRKGSDGEPAVSFTLNGDKVEADDIVLNEAKDAYTITKKFSAITTAEKAIKALVADAVKSVNDAMVDEEGEKYAVMSVDEYKVKVDISNGNIDLTKVYGDVGSLIQNLAKSLEDKKDVYKATEISAKLSNAESAVTKGTLALSETTNAVHDFVVEVFGEESISGKTTLAQYVKETLDGGKLTVTVSIKDGSELTYNYEFTFALDDSAEEQQEEKQERVDDNAEVRLDEEE